MLIRSFIPLLVLTLFCSMGWTQGGLPYQTGFETDEGFGVAPRIIVKESPSEAYIDDKGSRDWQVLEGSAAILEVTEASNLAEGQMLEIHPESMVDATRSGSGDESVVWLQSAYRTAPQDATPDVEGLGPSSALMYFDSQNGIMVYNGFTPGWEAIGYPVDPTGNSWYLITIKLNFPPVGSVEPGTWDIYVDSTQPQRSGIGFKDTGLTQYNGFRCRSGEVGAGCLDNFYVGQSPPPNLATPTPTPSPTPSPSPTPQVPQYVGAEFFLYSIHWDPEGFNDTPFTLLNLYSDDDVIDWLDIYEYMEEWRVQR